MKRTALGTLILFAAILLLASCTSSGPCNGSLTLENPIPDTTVAVGDTLFIDLTDPPVFVSTKGEVTYDYSVISGVTNSNMNLIGNKGSILTITGRAVGESILELKGFSGCLENNTTINITVIES